MSGKDEQPKNRLVCPICAELGRINTHWALFVGDTEAGNWGRYNLKTMELDKRFLSRHIGKKVTRVKCFHRQQNGRVRHIFKTSSDIYWSVMKVVKFRDGIVE